MIKKPSSAFFCQTCGAQSSKWLGKCPSCHNWNTYLEETIHKKNSPKYNQPKNSPQSINNIDISNERRILTDDHELNRVLGGGIVPGSLILLGGEPGVGKSTLLLQLALRLVSKKILYISGEESEKQIKMRAERITYSSKNCFILCETSLENLFDQVKLLNPEILIIDSVQTLHTSYIEASPGSISQIKACAGRLLNFAKTREVAIFLIGHITKDGSLAGPKIMEHMVDTVLQFEGDRNHIYRLLRTSKNRFGSASELGVYQMSSAGLKEIKDPSGMLISERSESISGVAISVTNEGLRSLLIEIQALVSSAVYGTPQRTATGYDNKRLNMLLAVLEKKCGFHLSSKDVFLNITGGIKIDDPATDLAIICAVLSADQNIPLEMKLCFAAEIGLTGELRSITRIKERILEAQKLGYEQIIVSKNNKINQVNFKIKVIRCTKVEEVFSLLF